MRGRSSEAKLMAVIIVVAGLILIAYSLLVHQTAYNGYSGMMGTGSPTASSYYGLTNMVLAIFGTFMLTSGVLYAVLRVDYEPMTYQMMAAPIARRTEAPRRIVASEAMASDQVAPFSNPPIPESHMAAATVTEASKPSALNEQNYLILRLLTGDERIMFRTIMDSGGVALQRDLVAGTKMSEAKVSRVIDRLIEKGIIVKERNGMGNKISIHVDR